MSDTVFVTESKTAEAFTASVHVPMPPIHVAEKVRFVIVISKRSARAVPVAQRSRIRDVRATWSFDDACSRWRRLIGVLL